MWYCTKMQGLYVIFLNEIHATKVRSRVKLPSCTWLIGKFCIIGDGASRKALLFELSCIFQDYVVNMNKGVF